MTENGECPDLSFMHKGKEFIPYKWASEVEGIAGYWGGCGFYVQLNSNGWYEPEQVFIDLEKGEKMALKITKITNVRIWNKPLLPETLVGKETDDPIEEIKKAAKELDYDVNIVSYDPNDPSVNTRMKRVSYFRKSETKSVGKTPADRKWYRIEGILGTEGKDNVLRLKGIEVTELENDVRYTFQINTSNLDIENEDPILNKDNFNELICETIKRAINESTGSDQFNKSTKKNLFSRLFHKKPASEGGKRKTRKNVQRKRRQSKKH